MLWCDLNFQETVHRCVQHRNVGVELHAWLYIFPSYSTFQSSAPHTYFGRSITCFCKYHHGDITVTVQLSNSAKCEALLKILRCQNTWQWSFWEKERVIEKGWESGATPGKQQLPSLHQGLSELLPLKRIPGCRSLWKAAWHLKHRGRGRWKSMSLSLPAAYHVYFVSLLPGAAVTVNKFNSNNTLTEGVWSPISTNNWLAMSSFSQKLPSE